MVGDVASVMDDRGKMETSPKEIAGGIIDENGGLSESLRTSVLGSALGMGENFVDEVESVSICGERTSSASSAREALSQEKTPFSRKVGVTVVQEK